MGSIRQLFSRRRRYDELSESIREHLDEKIADLMDRGMTREEAERTARREFGNVTRIEERSREVWQWPAVESIWTDLKYALRQLSKHPIFSLTAILTLALGIGATTAIFSVMNAVLLRSLPVPNPQELVYLHLPDGQPDGARSTGDSSTSFSLPSFEALRQDRSAFSEVMAFAPLSHDEAPIRVGNDLPEQASVEMVSGNFFDGLGIPIVRGRTIVPEDETQHAAVAILSYAYWTRRFSRSPDVVGRVIHIKGIPFIVVGVANERFHGLDPSEPADFWIPLQRNPDLNPWGNAPNQTLYGSPNWWCLRLIARLRPGISAQQAIAQAIPSFQAAAYASLGTPDPAQPKIKLIAVPAKGIQGLDNEYNEPITILMILVVLVLAIACSNVAMLIVARNVARQRDFSLRMALGAGRTVLIRQLFTESGLLVISGALLGWGFALTATRALASWAQFKISLAPDHTVFLFTSIVSVLAVIVFGVAPIRTATNAPITSAAQATLSARHQRKSSSNTVLVTQIALCFTLLTAAGLLLRTLLNYENTNLGMRTQGLLVFGITPQKETSDDARLEFYAALLNRVRTIPGVESATLIRNRLGGGWTSNGKPTVDGIAVPQVSLRTNDVGSDFLHTLGIPLLRGRDILDSDTARSPRVVIVNETFVKKLLSNVANPIGHRLGDLKENPYIIIGVAANSKYRSVDEAPLPMAYYPYTQAKRVPTTIQVELRTIGNPLAFLPSVERAVHQLDANLPLEKPMTQVAVFEDSYSQQHLFSRLALFFAFLAALLVGIGLYGTLSYRVSRRSAEIGIRMALGAQRSEVLGLILRESFQIAVIGTAIGIPCALAAGHFMESMLYELRPYDMRSLLSALAGIIGVSFAAAFIPAYRAAHVDPIQALRSV